MMKQTLERLVAEMNAVKERMEVKQGRADANLRELKAEIRIGREEMTTRLEGRIDASSEKIGVLRSTLLSRWTSTKLGQSPLKKTYIKKMEASIPFGPN
jgi:hypothetical protein